MTKHALTDRQRRLIYDLALGARELLTREARELLEGTYGLYPNGWMDPLEKLPQVKSDPEAEETYHRLKRFIDDEVSAGLAREEAVEKLVKEVAYTHLNRLAAFKMMEARKLIRGTLDRGPDSNAFKFYLASPEHADDFNLYQRGEIDSAYRHFLLWQSGQVAQEIRVLFDPDNLVSRLFPRPRALKDLLAMLNKEALADAWLADETVGWIYQYFNEPELQAAFAKVGGGEKFEADDIPSATQLFTPHWIVRYLVQNTLGRLWVQMHPDTRLIGTELLDYLVPLEGEVPAESLRPVREITLLDPACGGMHFGLVAFDLFHAMYAEELERAGEPGWLEIGSVDDEAEIPAAIIKHNLFGIDIDLRAVQLAALALFLKAKSYNKNARITDNNLTVAGVLPLNDARLGAFLRDAHFTRPVYERLLRALWTRLHDARQLGSLLRLETDLAELVETERRRYRQAPLFAGVPGEFEAAATDEAFWEVVGSQIVRSLHEFAREQANEGHDQSFFVGEAVKGLRLLDLMLQEYDVVVTNPPYMSRRKMNTELAKLVSDAYPEGKNDLFAAFIQRCLEFTGDNGYVGMLTMHSFMFISSYESLRTEIRRQAAISSMAHCGPALFDVGNPGTLQTTAFVLRREASSTQRENELGVYYRLVHAPDGEGKRLAFEQALRDGSKTYRVAQERFDTIPGKPWVYWLADSIFDAFLTETPLGLRVTGKHGLSTCDTFRYTRYWWEPRHNTVQYDIHDVAETEVRGTWFPFMKGGTFKKWFGNQEFVVNWRRNGIEIRADVRQKFPYLGNNLELVLSSDEYYFREGVTWTKVSSKGLSTRYMPPGFIIADAGMAFYPTDNNLFQYLALTNSTFARYVISSISPTINFTIGDILALPIPSGGLSERLGRLAEMATQISLANELASMTTPHFVALPRWGVGQRSHTDLRRNIDRVEAEIDREVYRLFDLTDAQIRLVEAEEQLLSPLGDGDMSSPFQTELAAFWISYALGAILNCFRPGSPGALGSAVYRRSDFAVGSLPAPSEEEFDELIGPAEQFAYVDDEGGRHVFPRAVEQALRDLALPDGIAVFDEGHPRDLPALVDQALRLMLGDEAALQVIQEATGNTTRKPLDALRAFLERDFFTKWHFRWYRKRPVYWPLQSAKRSYGFVLFHEKIDGQTFYKLQREYLDHKLNSLRLHVEDLRGQAAGLTGAPLKKVEREIDQTSQLLEEIGDFARTVERIVQEGYQPRPNWIDDGVILRMAPLWELLPIWKAEPRKYWERLQKGDFDWSHIAMAYWPERVRAACKTNKSFAIAHGHPGWYEGG